MFYNLAIAILFQFVIMMAETLFTPTSGNVIFPISFTDSKTMSNQGSSRLSPAQGGKINNIDPRVGATFDISGYNSQDNTQKNVSTPSYSDVLLNNSLGLDSSYNASLASTFSSDSAAAATGIILDINSIKFNTPLNDSTVGNLIQENYEGNNAFNKPLKSASVIYPVIMKYFLFPLLLLIFIYLLHFSINSPLAALNIFTPGYGSEAPQAQFDNLEGLRSFNFFYSSYTTEFLNFNDIQLLGFMIYLAFPFVTVLVGVLLWCVLIGVLRISGN